jgi:hypothetical protein
MTDDQKKAALKLIESIDKLSINLGIAARELRDNVEFTSKEVSILSSEIKASSQRHSEVMDSLIDALNRNSVSSDKWALWMVALTVILTIADLPPINGTVEK